LLDEILNEIKIRSGPVTTRELARRLEIEEGALEAMLEFLERKGKLTIYRPGEECEECTKFSCASCAFRGSCPGGDKGGVS